MSKSTIQYKYYSPSYVLLCTVVQKKTSILSCIYTMHQNLLCKTRTFKKCYITLLHVADFAISNKNCAIHFMSRNIKINCVICNFVRSNNVSSIILLLISCYTQHFLSAQRCSPIWLDTLYSVCKCASDVYQSMIKSLCLKASSKLKIGFLEKL